MNNLYRFFLCLLIALFLHEAYLVGFLNVEPNKDIVILSMGLGSLMMIERLLISIAIEHIILSKKG